MMAAGPGARRTMSPFLGVMVSGTCMSLASRACSAMWRRMPWVGTAIRGRAHWYIWRSSSRQGWPDTWMPGWSFSV